MRNVFIDELIKYAKTDPDLIVLTGDMGYRALEIFRDKFPKQFLNVGVAEANMISVATGLALSGKKVCVYSVVPFVTLRIYEAIRNYVSRHNLDIKIIGVGGGFSYGSQGISHHSYEDLSIMRTLPNMTVILPADTNEARALSRAALNHKGPVYLRLGKSGERKIYPHPLASKLGQAVISRPGNDITLFSIGNILETALEVAENLAEKNISASVISVPCLKPLDKKIITRAALKTKAIFTLEEHLLTGGLGTAVAEVLVEKNLPIIFKKFALPDEYKDKHGSQQYLREIHGLSAEHITREIIKTLNSRRGLPRTRRPVKNK